MWKFLFRCVRYYMLLCGVAVHVALVLWVAFYALPKLLVQYPSLQLVAANDPVIELVPVPAGVNGLPDYSLLPPGRWWPVHRIEQGDEPYFSRQRHSGSAWDSRRNRLLVFGSDTHGQNWDNSVYSFSLDSLAWAREYQPDDWRSYAVDAKGNAIAGFGEAPRPWAMHVFDAMAYDPGADALIVASAAHHLEPGRFDNTLVDIWDNVSRHPTWVYNFVEQRWRYSSAETVDFFPYATAWDSHTNRMLGFRPDGIYEFEGLAGGWNKVGSHIVNAWHTQVVYDSVNHVFLSYGNNQNSDALVVYRAGEPSSEEMPTPGLRPPGGNAAAMAFHNGLARSVVITPARQSGMDPASETWLYDASLDAWERLETAVLPVKPDMNYHLQYSEKSNILVLFTGDEKASGVVWVLRM